ncbi:ArsR/SmtB family transcription factor [Acetobacterium carbinolicum]|jgi:ArsR family transcriptional regulator|uniref:ArsR/SmtB family transcription factor n=1 Tax=Acetobacterium TaxID=33951 RepID=UPI000DBEAF49|nr:MULTISPECIES: metalloregulator ArsR/SmtB family transcription factor [unclassified Acetobacterium]AWW25189.1 ArsR family transcriptional regulator [Acetobacterium sp. KB-1]MDK2941061.1 ArsR family transcriptional regulator, arsenate/arsenite/antimonite-responsive transcriptional [Acetobacterium sp.]MDZ5725671.1 metalloregulator ArsR/SmtB family transcription factor [Acetobacterium sp. K1/6]
MKSLINIFKVLSDETRLRIILLLTQSELCVCELSYILDVSQPNVSKNLAKLKELSLVTSQRKEKYIFYQLRNDNMILTHILNDILDNLEDYPQLVTDQNRNDGNLKWLDQCCNHRLNKQ